MKNKATLSLIEQVIMILVFALSAAISLKIFAYGDSLSREKNEMDRAVLMAQNAAESLTAAGGDFETAAGILGAELNETGTGLVQEEESGLLLRATETESGNPLLGEALISVSSNETEIYSLRLCWQEDAG